MHLSRMIWKFVVFPFHNIKGREISEKRKKEMGQIGGEKLYIVYISIIFTSSAEAQPE